MIGFDKLDKAKKNDFTKNKPKEDKDNALVTMTDGDKCMKVSEDMSLLRFSISRSMRL